MKVMGKLVQMGHEDNPDALLQQGRDDLPADLRAFSDVGRREQFD